MGLFFYFFSFLLLRNKEETKIVKPSFKVVKCNFSERHLKITFYFFHTKTNISNINTPWLVLRNWYVLVEVIFRFIPDLQCHFLKNFIISYRKNVMIVWIWILALAKVHLVFQFHTLSWRQNGIVSFFCQRLHTSLYTYFITYARILFLLYHLRHMFPLIRWVTRAIEFKL